MYIPLVKFSQIVISEYWISINLIWTSNAVWISCFPKYSAISKIKTWNLSCYPLIWPCTVTSLLLSWYDLRMHGHVWALKRHHLSFSSSFFFPSLSISGSQILSFWYLYTYEATMHGNNNKPTKRCCCHCKHNKSADIPGDFLEHEKEMSKHQTT